MSSARNQPQVGRRRFLQLAGAGAATAAGIGVTTGPAAAWDGLSWEDATEAAAAAGTMTLGAAGAATGAAYLSGREIDNYLTGSTFESGASTPEAIAESWYRTYLAGAQANDVTLQTLWNRLEDSRTVAYYNGQAKAIEQINYGNSESSVKNTSKSEVDKYYSKVQENLLSHWEIQAAKIESATTEFNNHDQVSSALDYCALVTVGSTGEYNYNNDDASTISTDSVTLLDNSTRDVTSIKCAYSGGDYLTRLSPHDAQMDMAGDLVTNQITLYPGGTPTNVGWMRLRKSDPLTVSDAETALSGENQTNSFEDFEAVNRFAILWDGIQQEAAIVKSNLDTWVSEAMTAIDQGEIDAQHLIENSPAAMAQQWSARYDQTGSYSLAAADLAAMGLSFDSDSRMVFQLEDGTIMEGTLYSSIDDFSFPVGQVIAPANHDGQIYVAADSSTLTRTLNSSEYRDSINSGEILLNVGVVPETQYKITTSAGEEITINWEDWSIPDGADANVIEEAAAVVYDASGDLSSPDASVSEISHIYAGDDEALTIELTRPFKIVEAINQSTGEEVSQVEGEGYNIDGTTVDTSWIDEYQQFREDTDNYDTGDDGSLIGGGGAIESPDSPDWNGMDWSWLNIGGLPPWLNLRNIAIAVIALFGLSAASSS